MTARVWLWGSIVALARVGALWFLIYREWTHQQSIETLPIVLLLFPEALLLPASMVWTVPFALVFSAALSAGSFLIVAVLALAVRLVRRPLASDCLLGELPLAVGLVWMPPKAIVTSTALFGPVIVASERTS